MKRILRLTAATIVVILVSISPAEALFGSECKKPKSTHSRYLTEYRKQLGAEKTTEIKFVSQRKRDYQQCLKNPKAFLLLRNLKALSQDKAGCGLWEMFYAHTESPKIMGRSSVSAYADAMLIVKSYQKCFEPSVYIEAVKWLKANQK
jgi:hypothetical protein